MRMCNAILCNFKTNVTGAKFVKATTFIYFEAATAVRKMHEKFIYSFYQNAHI